MELRGLRCANKPQSGIFSRHCYKINGMGMWAEGRLTCSLLSSSAAK